MNETATGKMRQDSKKPPAIRTNQGRKLLGKIFLRSFESARTVGEGMVTSSSDTLRKCSYDLFPGLLGV